MTATGEASGRGGATAQAEDPSDHIMEQRKRDAQAQRDAVSNGERSAFSGSPGRRSWKESGRIDYDGDGDAGGNVHEVMK